MKRYIAYFKYVIKHKWFVFQAALKVDPSLHLIYRAIMHDMSKFKPSEFIPYAKTFYKEDGSKQYVESTSFNLAWNAHQKCNKHHWQYWLLKMDRGEVIPMHMSLIFIKEMLADWLGAGRVINGEWDYSFEWYRTNSENIQISDQTRMIALQLMAIMATKYCDKGNK